MPANGAIERHADERDDHGRRHRIAARDSGAPGARCAAPRREPRHLADRHERREAELEQDAGEHRARDRLRDRGDEPAERRPQAGQHDEQADRDERRDRGRKSARHRADGREQREARRGPGDRDRHARPPAQRDRHDALGDAEHDERRRRSA